MTATKNILRIELLLNMLILNANEKEMMEKMVKRNSRICINKV